MIECVDGVWVAAHVQDGFVQCIGYGEGGFRYVHFSEYWCGLIVFQFPFVWRNSAAAENINQPMMYVDRDGRFTS